MNREWAVNIIAVEAPCDDEDLISPRQKKVTKKVTSGKDFIQRDIPEESMEKNEEKKKKDKIEMFPYRYVKFIRDK